MDFSPQRKSGERNNHGSFEHDDCDDVDFVGAAESTAASSKSHNKPSSAHPHDSNNKSNKPKTSHGGGPPTHSTSTNSISEPTSTTNNNADTITTTTTTSSLSDSGGPRSNSMESSISISSSTSSSTTTTTANVRRHTGGDGRWDAIQLATSQLEPQQLSLCHFRLLKRLGYGDIGSVYLVELRSTPSPSPAFFAMKVMDKASIISRNKMARAATEREILGLLDHPFLPTLYTHFETDKFYCLVMEYCSGGNLHSLRQKQPGKHFPEPAARFYVAEVLLAMEYLHMLGIVYRDLKPENVLVREDGHIMLSDFDLSLRCTVCPMLVKSSSVHGSTIAGVGGSGSGGGKGGGLMEVDGGEVMGAANQGCIQPSSFFPRILPRRSRKPSKSDQLAGGIGGGGGGGGGAQQQAVEFNAEPTEARSMSFVGTHEYLAPEIIRGEGHGSAVDWWTLGIFLYELLHGSTPFKGAGNRATLCNVIEQPLRFPSDSGGGGGDAISSVARDLIRGLLVKDPQKRIAFTRGATEIKQHPFFEGVNWALVRSMTPPSVPEPVDFRQYGAAGKEKNSTTTTAAVDAVAAPAGGGGPGPAGKQNSGEAYTDFECF